LQFKSVNSRLIPYRSAVSAVQVFTPVTNSGETNTVVADDTSTALTAGTTRFYGRPFTLPATADNWLLVAMTWKNAGTVAGNMLCGLELIANMNIPPTAIPSEMLAFSADTPCAGINLPQTVYDFTYSREPLLAGEIVIPFMSSSNGTTTSRYLNGASENANRVITDVRTAPVASGTAWSATVAHWYVQCAFMGYNLV